MDIQKAVEEIGEVADSIEDLVLPEDYVRIR